MIAAKSFPFKRLIHFAIAAGVIATLAYLGYRGQVSAVVLLAFGGVAMFIQLTFLELAARGLPEAGRSNILRPPNVRLQLSCIALADH